MRRVFFVLILCALALCGSALSESGADSKPVDDPTGETRKGGVAIASPGEAFEALPLTGYKIGIDPGHQARGNNEQEAVAPGSSETKAKVSTGTRGAASGVAEYIVNLDVSLMLRDVLEALGAEVLMTRETHEVDISNQQRALMMNDWGADVVLRIHCNGASDSSVSGMGMYIRKTGERAEESYILAGCLAEAMKQTTGAKCNGLYRRDTYTGLNWSLVPSVLVEMGYMSNRAEDMLLNDPEYQQKLVIGMANGIINYLEGGYNELN